MVRQEIDKRPKAAGNFQLTGGQARCEVLYVFGNATFLTATMP